MRKHIYKIWLMLLCALFVACSDNKSVSSYTQEIATTPKILITFNEPITTQDKQGSIHTADKNDKIIALNGEAIRADYAFKSTYELLIIPSVPALKPNAEYRLEIKLSKLVDSMLEDNLNLKLHTKPTEVLSASLEPDYIDEKSFYLNARISLSQIIDTSDIREALKAQSVDFKTKIISLSDDAGSQIPFSFESQKDEINIQSEALPIEQAPKTYTLTLKADYFGFEEDEVLRYVRTARGLEVEDIAANSSQKPSITISFSQILADNANIQDFISITPNIAANIAKSGNKLIISAPFGIAKPYTVRVKEGIKSIDGLELKSPREERIIFEPLPPSLVFSQQGVFLPTIADKKLSFKSINVNRVHLKISRIYPNNITAYLYKQNLIGDVKYNANNAYDEYDTYGIYSDFEQLGDVVFEQSFDIPNQANEWIQNQLDFSALKAKEGIFIVELSFGADDVDAKSLKAQSYDNAYFLRKNGTIQKHLIFSNIALIAQRINDKLEVFALDIASNKPLSQVQIQAISHKNQSIAKANTNEQGIATFENLKDVMYLSATKGDSTTILRLNAPLVLDSFDVKGLESTQGVNAYIYTDRGVYRPGEKAHINIIARADSKPITHPIYISITSPQGKKVVDKQKLTDNLFGFFNYEFDTDKNAPTGVWRIQADVGGSAFWHNVSLESVVPNRIKVELKTDEELTQAQIAEYDSIPYAISSSYLFGAPAANLTYTNQMYIQGVDFTPKVYRDYTFANPSSLRYSFNDTQEGQLDSKGFVEGIFNVNDLEHLNQNLRAFMSVKVFENGGRYVMARKNIDITLFDSFVGIKAPKAEVSLDSHLKIPIIVLSKDSQKLLANRPLTYRIYHSAHSWWWDYDSYDSFARSMKSSRHTKLIQEGSLTSSDKPIMLDFTPTQHGEMLLEVEDMQNHNTSAVLFYVGMSGEPSLNPKANTLAIKADKSQYQAGERAKISFESVQDAKALVSVVSANKVLERFWLDTKDTESGFELLLKDSYAPNVYVSVSVLQDYKKLDNDRAQRLYGVIPIMVENTESKLNLALQAPQSIRPNTDFSIKLSNKEGKKVAYSVAVVDEGLLNLTDFISPNPWAYFYQKLAFMLESFDNYDLIIGRDMGQIHKVFKVGGDMMLASAQRKDLSQAQRFKPVAFYTPPIMSDEQGRAEVTYKMPAYMGSVRIMAVALNDTSYGAAAQNMQVSAPVAMLSTIPRSLKIGDVFSLAIEVVPTQHKAGKTTLKLASGDKIHLDKQTFTLDFSDTASQIIHTNAKVSPDSIGQDFIDIVLENGDFTMQERTDIDILPFNPYTTLSKKFTLEPNATLTLQNPKHYIKDSQRGYVLISQSPIMSIEHRLRWLIRYPYGCIEQTTSSLISQLFLHLSGADSINKAQIVKDINAGISRIATFQTSDGGFAYWQGGNSADAWGSAYAGHFLLLAKAQGYYVPQDMLRAWINYETYYVKNAPAKQAIYPLYLLSLAGEPQLGLLNYIYEHNFNDLDISDKWLLAAAYKLASIDDIAQKITHNLPTKSPKHDESYYKDSYGSNLRDDAIILKAYTDIYKTPKAELAAYIQEQLEGQEWYSTQTLGFSLLALAGNNASVKADSIMPMKFSLAGKVYDEALDSIKVPFSAETSKLISQSDKPLYVNQVWEGILLQKDIKPNAQKIALSREFYDEQGKPIDVGSLPSGSSFYLSLTLTNANKAVDIKNVAITQILPSGWEIENTRLSDEYLPNFARNDADYTDMRDDRVMWFLDFNSQKAAERKIFVKINTITPGEYVLPPATADAMYDNSFLANTASLPVVITSN